MIESVAEVWPPRPGFKAHLEFQMGLPEDKLDGTFLGIEANWYPHLLRWSDRYGCWVALSWDSVKFEWEASMMMRGDNEGLIVAHTNIAEDMRITEEGI